MDSLWSFHFKEDSISHHGIEGQKWGIRNGPPYPLGSGQRSKSEVRAMRQRPNHSNTKKVVGRSLKQLDTDVISNINKDNRSIEGGWYNCVYCSLCYIYDSVFGLDLKAPPLNKGFGTLSNDILDEIFSGVNYSWFSGIKKPKVHELVKDSIAKPNSTGIVIIDHHALNYEKTERGYVTLVDTQSGDVYNLNDLSNFKLKAVIDFSDATIKQDAKMFPEFTKRVW